MTTQQNSATPRLNELVRIATLGRHVEQGLVASFEIIDDGGRWSVRVHDNERAEGPKTRFLTSQRQPGPKHYACISTVWRVLTEHGITTATINKVTRKK
ncbi:MAG: hypothetical protein WBG92_01030 [Thiohalocapsa sp.]